MVMLSLRGDRYTTDGTYAYATNNKFTGGYKQNALSPKLGIVYQVIKEQSFHLRKLHEWLRQPCPFTTQPDGTVLALKPQYANQWGR